jgi:thiamine-phosphate pyrophosphorylase
MNKSLHGLYVITDQQLMPAEHFCRMAEAALSAGARLIQYRDKSRDADKRLQQARELRRLCNQYNALLIINDDIELTLKSEADGIHIGKDDAPLGDVRKQLGVDHIIGVSCYNDNAQAQRAVESGADYIAFGSFFGSQIKPDAPRADTALIRQIKASHSIPVCCIGGINRDNCGELISQGADMLAVISDVFAATDDDEIKRRCEEFIQQLTRHSG